MQGKGCRAMSRDMEVDSGHLLEDLKDMYDSPTEMVTCEAAGNALEAPSTTLETHLGEDSGGRYVLFVNNGPAMSNNDFENYHRIARSSKRKGSSLGWAGIGAKLYLGAWDKSRIVTESSDGRTTLASVMFMEDGKAKWDHVEPTRKQAGTSYKVYLKPEHHEDLSTCIGEILLRNYNTAIRNGLAVHIDGRRLSHWEPSAKKTIQRVVKAGGATLPITVWLTEEDIPDNRCNIEYHVSGKRVVKKKPAGILACVKRDKKKKFHVIVDAMNISSELKTNKCAFKPGLFTKYVEPEIEKQVARILDDSGYLENQRTEKTVTNNFTKFLSRVIMEKFPWLKLNSGIGIPGGRGQKKVTRKKGPHKHRQTGGGGDCGPRGQRGFSFVQVFREEDQRQGWINPLKNQIVANLGHIVAKRLKKSGEGLKYHINRIIIDEILKFASKDGKLTVEQAFEMQNEIIALWEKERQGSGTASRFTEEYHRRDIHGRFSGE